MLHIKWPLHAAVSSLMLLTSTLPILPQAMGQTALSDAHDGNGLIGTADWTGKILKLVLDDDDGSDGDDGDDEADAPETENVTV